MSFADDPANRVLMQEALARSGDYAGTVDGIFGPQTKAAIRNFRARHGMGSELIIDNWLLDSLNLRRSTPKGNPMSNWLTTFVTTTAFKYLVAMAATFIAAKLGIEQGSVEGILTQLVAVAMGVWGMWESSRQKIVINGEKVSVSKLTPSEKATVASIVADKS